MGHGAVVKLLLNTPGVDINSKDMDHRTPLDVATKKRYHTVVQILQSALDEQNQQVSSSATH
jgi:ankyrin repeat protein